MPKFYFDVADGDVVSRDPDGIELLDFDAATRAAVGLLPELARDELPDGFYRDFTSSVRDEQGEVVFKATLSLRCQWPPKAGQRL